MGRENEIDMTHTTVRNYSRGGSQLHIFGIETKTKKPPDYSEGKLPSPRDCMNEGAGNGQIIPSILTEKKNRDKSVFAFKTRCKIHRSGLEKLHSIHLFHFCRSPSFSRL